MPSIVVQGASTEEAPTFDVLINYVWSFSMSVLIGADARVEGGLPMSVIVVGGEGMTIMADVLSIELDSLR